SAVEALAFGQGTVTKRTAIMPDLNGIAKGVGVDRLAEPLSAFGVRDALVGIDGEMRAMGHRPDAQPWTVAVEKPDPDRRAPHSVLALTNCAVATSGDYRHFVTVDGRRLSHTIDPKRGAPLLQPPASVTVIAPSCALADAWARALMVLGPAEGSAVVRKIGLEALFLLGDERDTVRARGVGNSFEHAA